MAEIDSDFLDELAVGGTDDPQETPEDVAEDAAPEEVAETVEQPESPAAEVPTTPEVKEDKSVPLAALLAERDKRKELERKIAEIQEKNKQELPDFYADPQAHVQMIEQRAQARINAVLEDQAREAHADYDDVMQVVLEAAAVNPAIKDQVFAANNPAMAAYKLGKQLIEHRDAQDPEKLRAKLVAEIRAELAAEFSAKPAKANVPPDISQTRSASGQFTAKQPTVVDELFPKG